MTSEEAALDRLRTRVPVLEQRIDLLEDLVLRVLVAVTLVLLAVGSVLTVAVDADSEVGRWSLLSAPVRLYGTLLHSENVPYTLVVMVGAGVLVIAAFVAAGLCLSMLRREGSQRTSVVAQIVTVVLLAGGGVQLILSAVAGAAGNESAEAGPAMWWFIPGAVLFALLVRAESLRRLWYRGD